MSEIRIGNDAYNGANTIIETAIINNLLKATGVSDYVSHYASFIGVLAHEKEHALNQIEEPTEVRKDDDEDHIDNTDENLITFTKPDDPWSAGRDKFGEHSQFKDDEVYAGGPVEQLAYNGADTSQDWASPGTNKGS